MADKFDKFHPDEFKAAMQGLTAQAEFCKLDLEDPKIKQFMHNVAEFNAQAAANMRQLSNIMHNPKGLRGKVEALKAELESDLKAYKSGMLMSMHESIQGEIRCDEFLTKINKVLNES